MKISFLIPAYNEEKNIGNLLKELKSCFPDQEIIVIDDASTDSTFQIAAKICGNSVIRHNKNRGPGAAVKTGILNATGDFVVIVDADGQHPVEEIKKVVDYLLEDPAVDAVFTQRSNVYSSGFIRSGGKFLISYVVKRLIGEKIRDHNCGLRAFKKERILPFLFMLPDGFSYVTTSLILAYKEDFGIHWIEIAMKQRKLGKSRVRIRHGFDTLLLATRLIVIFDPLKFFLPITGYSFLLGVASVMNSLIRTRTIGKNYIFFFLFGVLMFILGLLSEQISMLRKEIFLMKAKNDR
jgi:glycosyltransferase involved in cell wall biosynthesis